MGVNFIVTLSERLSTLVSTKGLYTAGNWTSSVLCLNQVLLIVNLMEPLSERTWPMWGNFCCLNIVDALSLLYTKLTVEKQRQDSRKDLVPPETELYTKLKLNSISNEIGTWHRTQSYLPWDLGWVPRSTWVWSLSLNLSRDHRPSPTV